MKTVTLVTQKGGSGKSTLAINLATTAQTKKRRVLLMDLDPQQTSAKWYQRRKAEHPAVVAIAATQLPEALKRAKAAGIDVVFVDTAGRDDPSSATAIKHSDYCLVATRPTPADMEALEATIEVLKRNHKPFAFVIVQAPPSGFRIIEADGALGPHGDVAPVPIVHRVAYQDALGNGQGIKEFGKDGNASREMMALWYWLNGELRKLDG